VNDKHYVEERETISPVMKVPRQCPLVRLVEVMHMVGISFYGTGKTALYSNFV
jgi:hypothetical protein